MLPIVRTRVLLVPLATLIAAAMSAPCSKYCTSSCCGFSEPAKECGGCDSTVACHPGAKCYDGVDRPPSPPSFTGPNGLPCEAICHKASCCGFSTPEKSCGGCDESYICNPSATCYDGKGSGGVAEPAAAGPKRHEHAPEGKRKKHEHTPEKKKKHEHTPEKRKKHEHAPETRKKHEHAPEKKKKHEHAPGDTKATPAPTPAAASSATLGGAASADAAAGSTGIAPSATASSDSSTAAAAAATPEPVSGAAASEEHEQMRRNLASMRTELRMARTRIAELEAAAAARAASGASGSAAPDAGASGSDGAGGTCVADLAAARKKIKAQQTDLMRAEKFVEAAQRALRSDAQPKTQAHDEL